MRYEEHRRRCVRVLARAIITAMVGLTLIFAAQTSTSTRTALAKPTDTLSINPDICASLTGATWNHDSNGDTITNSTDATYACDHLNQPAMLADLASELGGNVNLPDTYAYVSDAGGNELNANTGELWVLVFVTNDDQFSLDADEGVWDSSDTSLTSCVYIGDEDCDFDGFQGDGVIVDLLMGNGVADLGDCQLVATQSGVDFIFDYTVVGDPTGPADILSINPNICASLTGATWYHDSNEDTVINTADATYACDHLNQPPMLADLASELGGDVDEPDSYAYLSNAGGDQLNQNTGELWVLVFVPNDDSVALDADEGVWDSSNTYFTNCPGSFADEDCDDDGVQGDGVVVDMLLGNGVAAIGDAQAVATQSGTDVYLNYVVVGDPVGGMAEHAQLEPEAASSAHGSPGSNTLALAGIAAGGALLLAAGAWGVRRRRAG